MLRRIFSLTRLFVRSAFFSGSGQKKRKWTRILLYVILYGYLTVVMGIFAKYLLGVMQDLRQPQAFVTLILLANVMLTLFTTIISSLNVLYFSEDNAALLPMPIRPMEMVAGRLNALLVIEYMEELLLGAVPLGVYAVLTAQPWYFYIVAILVLLVLPIVPVMFAALLIMTLMSTTGKIRNKKAVQAVTTVISLVLAMGAGFLSSSQQSEDMIISLVRPNGLATVLGKYMPTVQLGASSLNRFSIASLLLLILVSVLAYLLMILFSQKLYYKGMVGSLFSSSGVSKKKINEQTAYRSSSVASSYIRKEIRTYFRKPIYLVQLVLPCIIMPIFMAVIFYVSLSNAMKGDGMSVVDTMRILYGENDMLPIVFYVCLMVQFFSSMYSFLSCVAISKDGHDAAFMKTIPVPFYKQVIYKAVPDILMTLFIYVLVGVLMAVLFVVPAKVLLCSMAVCIPYAVLHGFIILLDLKNPKLQWNNEMEVVKNNMRTLIPVGIGLGNVLAVGLCGFWLNMSIPVMTAVFAGVYIVLIILLFLYIRKADLKLADHIS